MHINQDYESGYDRGYADGYAKAKVRIEHIIGAVVKSNDEICQTLAQALGYPWFKDDQKNFPGATEAQGVCYGDHVAETLAMEAARRIKELSKSRKLIQLVVKPMNSDPKYSTLIGLYDNGDVEEVGWNDAY